MKEGKSVNRLKKRRSVRLWDGGRTIIVSGNSTGFAGTELFTLRIDKAGFLCKVQFGFFMSHVQMTPHPAHICLSADD